MGRSSKFIFPLPGRKQKSNPHPSISAPLSKAQKLLGTGEINISTTPSDSSRHWETHSNSGISVAVSDATTTTRSAAFSSDDPAQDGQSSGQPDRRRYWWDDEPDVLRGHLKKAASNGNMTDTSAPTLSHRESSSTIVSYYDKSKLPLSVSQQTSASAMARGLPTKASSILDIDGSRSVTPSNLRKKPSKLDLSHFLSRKRSDRHLAAANNPDHDSVRRHNIISPNPPAFSSSPDLGLRHQPSADSLRNNNSSSRPLKKLDSRARAAASTADLHDLYDHFERRSLEDQSLEDAERAERETVASDTPHPAPAWTPSHQPAAANGFLSPTSHSNRPPASPSRTFSTSAPSESDGPIAPPKSTSLVSPSVDCAASVSSRHTRTSKASKRTDLSLVDLDLQQNSVLSLSSDSEDDYAEGPIKQYGSAAPQYSSRDISQSPTSPSFGLPQFQSRVPAQEGINDAPRSASSSGGDYRGSDAGRPTAIVVNGQQSRAYTRSSSLSSSSAAANSAQALSRLSLTSTATNNSTPTGSNGYGIHEARAITVTTAQHLHCGGNHPPQAHSPIQRRASQASSYVSDLPTTPLSPLSTDCSLPSPNYPTTPQDDGSIRSGVSQGAGSFNTGLVTPPLSARASSASGRFMAVTRQEEMLLAALRMKRARMRGNTGSEPDTQQQDDELDDVPRNLLQPPQPHHRPAQPPPNQPPDIPLPQLPSRRPSQDRRSSTTRQVSRRASSTMGRLAPLHESPRSDPPASRQSPTDPSLARTTRNRRSRTETYQGESERAHILMCLGQQSSSGGEPDLDLGDLLNFDTGSSQHSSPASHSASNSRPRGPGQPPRLPLPVLTYGKNRAKPPNYPPPRPDSRATGRNTAASKTHGPTGDSNGGRTPLNKEGGVPRPDSPISASASDLPFPNGLPRQKQVRLSAVGYCPTPEVALWGDDG